MSDYSLYIYSKLVTEIEEILSNNELVKKKFKTPSKDQSGILEPRSGYLSEILRSIDQISNLIEVVDELNKRLPEIKNKNLDDSLIKSFIEIGKGARELYFYHRKSFHDYEDYLLSERIPKSKEYLSFREFYYARLSDYIHYTELLEPLGESLKRFIGSRKNTQQQECWITKNDKGQYLFDGNIVDIKNKDASYYIVFDACFSLKPNGGEIYYEDIIDECRKRGISETQKSIQAKLTANGTNALFFRYVKGIKQSPSGGVKLFRADQKGRYLQFNNKK